MFLCHKGMWYRGLYHINFECDTGGCIISYWTVSNSAVAKWMNDKSTKPCVCYITGCCIYLVVHGERISCSPAGDTSTKILNHPLSNKSEKAFLLHYLNKIVPQKAHVHWTAVNTMTTCWLMKNLKAYIHVLDIECNGKTVSMCVKTTIFSS